MTISRSPHTAYVQVPPLLTSYVSRDTFKISEQKLIYYYSIKSVIYSNFLFILNFLFLSLAPTQDSIQHLQVTWKFLRLSLVWMTLTVLRSAGHVFCGMGLCWNLSDVFPRLD